MEFDDILTDAFLADEESGGEVVVLDEEEVEPGFDNEQIEVTDIEEDEFADPELEDYDEDAAAAIADEDDGIGFPVDDAECEIEPPAGKQGRRRTKRVPENAKIRSGCFNRIVYAVLWLLTLAIVGWLIALCWLLCSRE